MMIAIGILFFVFVIVLLLFVFFSVSTKTKDAFNSSLSISTIEDYIKNSEDTKNISDLHNKQIIWHNKNKQQTDVAIVYIHGFVADKNEIRPVPDTIAQKLGANIFYTRLHGHWQEPEVLEKATFSQWVYDTQEAIAIGKIIGKKVILMSTSTGGTLVSHVLTDTNMQKDIMGSVFVSPNYKIKDKKSFLLFFPFGKQIALAVNGKTMGSDECINETMRPYWIWEYPTATLMPMVAAVKSVAQKLRRGKIDSIPVPAVFLYSSLDDTVDYKKIIAVAKRWGKNVNRDSHFVQLHEIPIQEGMNPHVITGNLRSPQSVEEVSNIIYNVIQGW